MAVAGRASNRAQATADDREPNWMFAGGKPDASTSGAPAPVPASSLPLALALEPSAISRHVAGSVS
jgi:hypothetical protein